MSLKDTVQAAESPPKGAPILVYTHGIDSRPLNHTVSANSQDPLAYAWRTRVGANLKADGAILKNPLPRQKPAQWDEPVTQRTTLRHKIKGVMTKNSEYQSFIKFKFRFQIPIFKFQKHASDQHSKLLRRCQNSGVMGGLSPKEFFSDPPQRHSELYQ